MLPGETASIMSTTAGNGSYSTSTEAMASSASVALVARITATTSPTCRTLSPVRAGKGGMTVSSVTGHTHRTLAFRSPMPAAS